MPIVGRSAPFIFNRNGKKVRNPIRVALSIIAIASSSRKSVSLSAPPPQSAGFRRSLLDVAR